ncbi:MAG: hypothetical protein ACOWYE_18210 [Desulfatiglandales bacterium]
MFHLVKHKFQETQKQAQHCDHHEDSRRDGHPKSVLMGMIQAYPYGNTAHEDEVGRNQAARKEQDAQNNGF